MNTPRRRARGFAFLPFLMFVVICGVLWWQRAAILGSFGDFLNVGEPPQKADAAVVLAGGWQGERVLRAGQLARDGFVPLVLLSGPPSVYGESECVPAQALAVRQGFQAAWFQCVPNSSTSTKGEANALMAEMVRRGIKKALIVSVASHLRRARRLFSDVTPPGLELHFVAADPPDYRLHEWYKAREGRKAIFQEWVKLVTSPFGI